MENNEKPTKMRHSLAHILAAAIKSEHPEAKLGIGPVIENGFYYDFDFSDVEHSPAPDCLPKLEEEMKKLIKEKVDFTKEEVSYDDAKNIFKDEPFKLELIEELNKDEQKITIYKNGGFTDLCAGPHIENTKELLSCAFKLDRIAGAYWKGSEENKMLTRIYGLAFETKDELENYLKAREEAEKNDHRVLADKLDLFMISEEVGKGLPLWLPNGAFIRRQLENYMYEKETERGYKHVVTPVLTRKHLYETSGHLAHYKDDMYNPIDIEGEEYYLKPMNCPHHHMIYKHRPSSYRDLPLRLAEFGLVHRFERSGVLTGLIRARCFTQNDSHMYCRKDQLKVELLGVLDLFKEVYNDFKIKNYWFRLSLPDLNDKEKYGDIKDVKMWEEAAAVAKEALEESKEKFVIGIGEASFYGPKIDIQIKNALGKEDTIATVQVDFYSPKRFDLSFANEKGEQEQPVIIHRAIMGSFDRFFAFLTEQTGGAFPVWLSPVQAIVLPITDKQNEYGRKVFESLKSAGVRAEINEDNESLGKKIRGAKMKKIPYLIVIGGKEEEEKMITVESRDGKSEKMTAENFAEKIIREIKDRK